MNALARLALSPLHAVLNLRYGTSRETCPFCLDRVPTGRLTLHCETNHAGDVQE